jgi:hypothetical protein
MYEDRPEEDPPLWLGQSRAMSGEVNMIVRVWRGWTTAANADGYEELIRSTIFPDIFDRGIDGLFRLDLYRRPQCRFGLRNMGITQASNNTPNSGHHHLLIDVDGPLDPNEPIPAGQDTSSFRRRAVCHNLHYRLSGKLTGGTTLLWGTECVMSSPR